MEQQDQSIVESAAPADGKAHRMTGATPAERAGREGELEAEIAYRLDNGGRLVTLAELDAELRAIGYRLDRRSDCPSRNRYTSGPRAGRGYPAVNLYVVQASDGLSAMHVDARRDACFEALQKLRFTGALFAVHRGRIYEI